MKVNTILRVVVMSVAFSFCVAMVAVAVNAQDVGGDIGGGAGIFKPRNPETKKSTLKNVKPVTKPTRTPVKKPAPSVDLENRIEELLDKGNDARDAKKYSEAQEAYEGVLKLKARDARGAYGLGNVYTDQRRWEEAERYYRDAVEGAPSNVDALVALSVVLVQPRSGSDNAKRFADAQSFAQRAVQLDPKNAVAWDRLGVAMQSRGYFNADTEHSYRRAVELDPQFAVAYAHLGRVLKRLGRTAEAAPLYDHASELAKDPATLVLIADSLQAEQQWADSEPVLRRSLDMDARNPSALFLLGRMLVVLKRYPEAESPLKAAIEVSPRSFQSYNLLGRAYLALDRYDDAEKTYNNAVNLVSAGDRKQLAGAFGFEGVGDGYMKAKRRSDAARVYQRALELDPGNPQLDKKLSKARG
jgi:tetratricopeptide (TPR) repeat protein